MPRTTRILLIDDSPAFLELERSFFRDLPYEIVCAGSGGDGLALARKKPADVVLLDEEMPDIAGHEVLAQLRADPATARTPVILVTASADEALIQRCMRLGLSDYIRKPFEPEALLRKVGKALGLAERKVVSFLVRVRRGQDAAFGRAADLSATGMRVDWARSLEVGEQVDVEFFPPGNRTQVRLRAEVARRLKPPHEGGDMSYGLRFMDVPAEARALIEEAIRSRH